MKILLDVYWNGSEWNIWLVYYDKIKELIQDLELNNEDYSISQMYYLNEKITILVDLLLLLVKHVNLMLYKLKKEKKD